MNADILFCPSLYLLQIFSVYQSVYVYRVTGGRTIFYWSKNGNLIKFSINQYSTQAEETSHANDNACDFDL